MKDKLEPNMYVRTKNGSIDKITDIAEEWYQREGDEDEKPYKIYKLNNTYYDDEFDEDTNWFLADFFIKASNNIIDLIEAGDILEINNEKYEVIYDESYEKLGILIPSKKELSIRHSALEYIFKKYKVSIVTKEQFESMEYRLGDE